MHRREFLIDTAALAATLAGLSMPAIAANAIAENPQESLPLFHLAGFSETSGRIWMAGPLDVEVAERSISFMSQLTPVKRKVDVEFIEWYDPQKKLLSDARLSHAIFGSPGDWLRLKYTLCVGMVGSGKPVTEPNPRLIEFVKQMGWLKDGQSLCT